MTGEDVVRVELSLRGAMDGKLRVAGTARPAMGQLREVERVRASAEHRNPCPAACVQVTSPARTHGPSAENARPEGDKPALGYVGSRRAFAFACRRLFVRLRLRRRRRSHAQDRNHWVHRVHAVPGLAD